MHIAHIYIHITQLMHHASCCSPVFSVISFIWLKLIKIKVQCSHYMSDLLDCV